MGELSLKRNDNYKQGYYYPKNAQKFIGKNPYAVYRSGLELAYFRKLDSNPAVVRWGSEEVIVPYYYNGKIHQYYIDLFVEVEIAGILRRFIIEIKPFKQTIVPKDSTRKKRETYLTECAMWYMNCAKWNAARAFAQQQGMEFHILTEKEIEQYK